MTRNYRSGKSHFQKRYSETKESSKNDGMKVKKAPFKLPWLQKKFGL
ncbi:hypothetical protein LEP1GSC108_1730 [Leptospira weilii str. UI 13098]|uniref:Uncharacterized protein n=1 Tax=Leptospira weilii str. UI 13098 TaxID=1088542 RepID=M6QHD5_9LEPT|nr:hypothetical protein LEP1GSC108_1730 [Leptospira weilii str. UI 13098]